MAERIWSPTFGLLAAATACFFVAFAIQIPILPRYFVATGQDPTRVGILLGAFSVTALLLRPIVGREIDRRGRKPFLLVGLVLSSVSFAGYVTTEAFGALLLLRLLHGAAIACFYPAASSVAADLAPPRRRAEMMSYFSMFLYAGLALGPAIGESLAPPEAGVPGSHFAPALLFAAGMAAAGVVAGALIREVPLPPEPDLGRQPLVSRAALFPAGVLSLSAVAWAATAYIPVYVDEAEGGDTRIFFITLAITVIALRFFVGRVADAYGRRAVVVPGTALAAVGILVLLAPPTGAILMLTGIVFGIGWGALFPGLLTIALDRVTPRGRGSAVGTFTAAFDFSFGVGQAFLGALWGLIGLQGTFIVAAAFAMTACGVFVAGYARSEARYPALEY